MVGPTTGWHACGTRQTSIGAFDGQLGLSPLRLFSLLFVLRFPRLLLLAGPMLLLLLFIFESMYAFHK